MAAPRARRREAATAYLFLTPNLALFLAFMFLPLVLVFWVAMQDKPTFGPATFVGLDNYRALLHDATFWRSMINTVGYTLIVVPLSLVLGMGLALLLNRRLPLRALFRSVFYLPVVISGLATGIITGWLFNEEIGVVNRILGIVGIGAQQWQSDPKLAVVTVVLVTLWGRVGFCMVIYLAALQGVSRELYDAAACDGATPLQRFRHITLPGVRYSTFFLVIMGIIESFQVFDLIFALTGGGPGDSTEVLGLYAYQTAFQTRERGYGAAIGVVLYVLILAVTLVQWRASRQKSLV